MRNILLILSFFTTFSWGFIPAPPVIGSSLGLIINNGVIFVLSFLIACIFHNLYINKNYAYKNIIISIFINLVYGFIIVLLGDVLLFSSVFYLKDIFDNTNYAKSIFPIIVIFSFLVCSFLINSIVSLIQIRVYKNKVKVYNFKNMFKKFMFLTYLIMFWIIFIISIIKMYF